MNGEIMLYSGNTGKLGRSIYWPVMGLMMKLFAFWVPHIHGEESSFRN